MAITQALLTADQDNSNSTSYATASITPTGNQLGLLAVLNTTGSGAGTPTVSGNGLTYVEIANVTFNDIAGGASRLTIFRTMDASPSTGVATIDFGAATQSGCCWSFREFDGVDTGGTNGSAAVVQSVTNRVDGNTSLTVTLAAFGSASNATYGAFGNDIASDTFTQGTGFTTLDTEGHNFPPETLFTEWRNDNDTTVDASASSGDMGGIGIEIKAAATTITIVANVQTLNLTPLASSIIAPQTISANVQTLTLTPLAVTIDASVKVQANVQTLQLTGLQSTIQTGLTVVANVQTLQLTGLQSTIQTDITVAANVQTLQLTGLQSTIIATPDIVITANVQTLQLTGLQSSIVTSADIVIDANVQTLRLTARQVSIKSGAAPLAISSFKENRSPSIIISSPIWASTGFVDDSIRNKMSGYSHTISAVGGYDSASISMTMRKIDAEDWFANGLGRHVEFFDHALVKKWEGFINEVRIGIGVLSASQGPLVDIVNRTAVVYQTASYNTNPPVSGQRATTTQGDNAGSQAKYGILESYLSGGTGTETSMNGVRDTFLAERGWPQSNKDVNFDSPGDITVELSCLGYYHLLPKYVYQQTTNTGQVNISIKIQDVLTADPSSRFSSDYSQIETNTTQINQFENEGKDALSVIQNAVVVGDGSGNRTLFGIYNDRKARYETIPTAIALQTSLNAKRQQVESLAGSWVLPWDVTPGQWMTINDFLIGQVQKTNPREDQRNIFIERVTYTAPYGLSVNGVQVETLPQLLAQYGLGSV